MVIRYRKEDFSMANTEYRLTTMDNPYDPFTEFDKWFLYDSEKGYNTCGLLARIVENTPNKSNKDYNDEDVEGAIDNIIKYDIFNMYKKVKAS